LLIIVGADASEIPYVVSGSGGFAATPPRGKITTPYTFGEYTLVDQPLAESRGLSAALTRNASNDFGAVSRPGRRFSEEAGKLHLGLEGP
jgi:hypothetical protein